MKLRVRPTQGREDQLARFGAAARDAELLRRQLEAAKQARAVEDQRREALIDCVVSAVPAALLKARSEAWDEGWEAACRGLPKTVNPARPGPD